MTDIMRFKSKAESNNWVKTLLFGSNATIEAHYPAFRRSSWQKRLPRFLQAQGRLSMSLQAPCTAFLPFSIILSNKSLTLPSI